MAHDPRPRPLPRRAPPDGSLRYEAILAAAEALFGAHGFRKAGIDEIAAQAGVSKPLIYHYFRSKEQLIQAFYGRTHQEHLALCRPILERETSLRGRLLHVMRAKIESTSIASSSVIAAAGAKCWATLSRIRA